ncbi:VC0807 family protein [Streptomyces sp. NRRL B-3648]|uniref:VC0807 family protein n=1 Tax=Streptomyces sp. NRRL B-3648 TaxID=1519493 RepID=UPI0006B00AE4|nr:VC0807 family protein [Streptomyces sp. NRRL B-3648]KOX01273.1 membrane protein [Streptomyces sp. NRRL B-3648]
MTKNTGNQDRQPSAFDNFKPLLIDVAVPLGSYYLFKDAFGMSTFAALAWSSVVPAVRTVWGLVKERTTNALAGLILVVNVVSLLLSFVSGDPRLMLAKDSAVSSTVAIGILVSVRLGKPMMTAGMKPFLVKGDVAKEAAWERLVSGSAAGSAAFRSKERAFSVVWGLALLTECLLRAVGAYTVPVDTMVWLGTVILIGAMAIGFVVGGGLAAGPMERMLEAEVEAGRAQQPTLAVAA